jgi:hypothetical protein
MVMSDDQPESFNADADQFERWLLVETESGFQEFIEQALSLLAHFTPELLCECKSRVDARLAAEPDTNVFSVSDPHIVRVVYWHRIADSLQAEINIRSLSSATRRGNPL